MHRLNKIQIKHNTIRLPQLFLLFLLLGGCGQVLAQCGGIIPCPLPSNPLNPPGICTIQACFKDAADKHKYEQENNCEFLPNAVCGNEPMDKESQCCGKNAKTGAAEIQQKQITQLNLNFDWDVYKKQCPNMQQSQSEPDALWQQCIAGEKHSAGDDYAVVTVEANGNARSYCIDGCSTPPGIVDKLFRAGIFIFKDKDNPTGAGEGGFGEGSSFYTACATHDKCYQTCSSLDQKNCDDQLLANSLAVCNRIPPDHTTTFINNIGFEDDENTREKCQSAANKMHTGLRLPVKASQAAFKMRRQQYCQCC